MLSTEASQILAIPTVESMLCCDALLWLDALQAAPAADWLNRASKVFETNRRQSRRALELCCDAGLFASDRLNGFLVLTAEGQEAAALLRKMQGVV